MVSNLQAMRLTILHLNVTTTNNDIVLYSLSVKVKRLTRGTTDETIGDLLSELGIMAHVSHTNTTKLVGYGVEGGMHLVLELSEKGSLASVLYGSKEKLPWSIRQRIALGTAEGILYLHEGCLFGFVVSGLAQKPTQLIKGFNFDYTKQSPVAYVPLISCAGVVGGHDSVKEIAASKWVGQRVLPPKQNVQVTVSLEVPKSGHNRNLGGQTEQHSKSQKILSITEPTCSSILFGKGL
ncbi:hypothetical protein S245_037160, partial [Arachis hypogaea]